MISSDVMISRIEDHTVHLEQELDAYMVITYSCIDIL
jgi:hypothetical protein